MAVYFASDFHLGLDRPIASSEREKIIISWLNSIKDDADELYLLGDLFDFWFEYNSVVPKGYVRLLAKISEFSDNNIPVHIFTGNHDMWMFGYLEDELGAQVHKQPLRKEIQGKKFLLGHGDGLGPGDHKYKLLKRIFSNKINQWLFARIHPNLGLKLMKMSSLQSRDSAPQEIPFLGPEKEWLIQYSERKICNEQLDFLIFGHRHLPIDYLLSNKTTRYINTGDWITYCSYAKLENGNVELLKYEK